MDSVQATQEKMKVNRTISSNETNDGTQRTSSKNSEEAKDQSLEALLDNIEVSEEDKIEVQEDVDKIAEKVPLGTFGNPKFYLHFLAIYASFGGFLYGVDQTLVSGALLYLLKDIKLNVEQESLITSAVSLGGIPGAIAAIAVNEALGRRGGIIIACLLDTTGAIMCAAARSYGVLLPGRLILGAGIGMEAMTVPTYIAECSPKQRRGGLVSLYQVMIVFGLLGGYVVDAIFTNVDGSWRYMLGSSLVFSTILMTGAIFFPESPRWLMKRGRYQRALVVWRKLRGFRGEEIEEFVRMKKVVETERQFAKPFLIVMMDFLRVPHCRRAFELGVGIMFIQEFSGVATINYYTGTLFEKLGMTPSHSVYMGMIGEGVFFFATIPAIYLNDKIGRRWLLLSTMPGIILGLIITGFSFYASDKSSKVGLYTWGVVTFYLFWGPGMGPVPWTINSEIFPTYIRTYGVASCTIMNFFGNWLTSYEFLRMEKHMTDPGVFIGFYGGIVFLGWIYLVLFMPETKNLTLEEIKQTFSLSHVEIAKRNWQKAIDDWHFIKAYFGRQRSRQQIVHPVSQTV
ncbi:MFS transporter, SP family, sugar:H+ symporter [Galdieria sulphuraria]|uniref:MFS transporter, SP family, sugar:H+ symporter n=1 Tax=Galdieria sulphuraria TaxID=130081 RepID=M2Y0A1_GALSU|nr:MFS transporter, SP family, sugar:H+ symporter [Galdieria sulphuraria]EME29318.1 MFS transporter, SP family, sugar:H+ symporter [Galdieria sulphuraria]|eukprot:XP_005705838.1 MFS transporter, SP family, sugar:H+ symporter [Galdieria sulphuraria]